MGKGYKRKTRWRTLNIADCPSAPPADEDDEDGIRRTRENITKNSSTTHKSHRSRSEQKNENGISDSSGSLPSRSQPKILFDENEYTRITAPRQDMLFKKGYLAKKKVWSGNNASTSATPSTTESQSASHSTADGSETAEDQQLLDYRENGVEEYPPVELAPHMNYGTYYDHASGYYYEYPVMVVGPPVPGPPMHNLLAAMPCEAVPLRPIEWVNPAFMPKYEQPYCLVNYQNPPLDQQLPVGLDENEITVTATEHTNGTEEPLENGNNSNWTETNDVEKQNYEEQSSQEPQEPINLVDYEEEVVDNSFSNEPCLETVLAQQLHVSPHVIPPVPQPYMYPGHYMFGPALVNVNGMTIQCGPMMRTSEIPILTSTFARRKKKKKLSKRKMRRPLGQENIENGAPEEEEEEEEEDYNSETENTIAQSSVTSNNLVSNSRPLNPNCKEFEFRPNSLTSQSTGSVTSLNKSASMSAVISENHVVKDTHSSNLKLRNSIDISCTVTPNTHESPIESSDVVTNVEFAMEAIANESNQTNGHKEILVTEVGVDVTCEEFNNIIEKIEDKFTEIPIQNPLEMTVPNGNEDCDRLSNGTATSGGTNESRDSSVIQRIPNQEILSKNLPRKKYKNTKVIRESTPRPESDEQSLDMLETELKTHVQGVVMGVDAIEAQLNADASNEDSGFESQTRYSDHPITNAVTEWLRRANSPEMFVTSTLNDEEGETEDDELDDSEPPKNLQGNPMPALSANSCVNDTTSLRPASYDEFARANCLKNEANPSKKKTRSKNKKRSQKNKNTATALKTDKSNHQRKKNRKPRKAKELIQSTCEFTEKDSDVGMRVAENSRIISKTNESITCVLKGSDSSRRVNTNVDVNQVKTFEKGEIVVSIDGKLLSTTIYGTLCAEDDGEDIKEEKSVNTSARNSLGSIEEPDMLECWDVETVEPLERGVIKLEEINDKSANKTDNASLEIVRKYYTLARGSVQSISSIEDGFSESTKQSDKQYQSRLISPEQLRTFANDCSIILNNQKDEEFLIDEGIEIYESCYNGKPPIIFNPNLYKSHSLYGHDEDRPIPCRVTCCIVQ
ncbi:uncharacterized protein [Chelonus insularis]|uniref:uncharacterized protein isoform X2 n=1 Tax=Chelonus insularis TaxID=460826 RepID=UPI00158C1391|nr:uncharacterized protein LOC118074916 isoform X2 [Chelonus insularis]